MVRRVVRDLYRRIHPLLFAKQQYKLFLRSALGTVDLRMLALASSTDYFATFVQSIPISAPFGASMLVVAPHQDDETIGCGGALALQQRSGGAANVLMLTDGADDHAAVGMTRQQMAEMRNEESRQAAAVIGMPAPRFLNCPDLTTQHAAIVQSIVAELERTRADAVFVPFVLDAHPDHRETNYVLAEALQQVTRAVRVLQYEVWGLCVPNVVVVIDDVIEAKREMLQRFKFANTALDYTNSTIGLNMFHSRMLGAGVCRYAERFFELPKAEYLSLVARVRDAERAASVPGPVATTPSIPQSS